MENRLSIEKPVDHLAQILLDKLKINNAPIDPRDIVKKIGLYLFEKNLGNSFDGCIICREGSATIAINNEMPETRKRFTIAHELGHFKAHANEDLHCHENDIDIAYTSKLREREANRFATELLMPKNLVKPLVLQNDIGISTIQTIAKTFQTSFTSSAIRFMEFTPGLVALVFSKERRIISSIQSQELRSTKKFKFEPTEMINRNSTAYSFYNDGGAVIKHSSEKEDTLPSIWFPNLDSSNAECFEEVIGFPNFGQTVTLISLNEKSSYEEDSEEDLDF